MQVQGMLGWGMAARGHEHHRVSVPSLHTLLAWGRHRGSTTQPRQIFGTGRYVPNCQAGQVGAGGDGTACIPAVGRRSQVGKDWVHWLWGSVRRGCYEKRQYFGTVCRGAAEVETFIPCSHCCCFLLPFQVTKAHCGPQRSWSPPPRRATSPWYHL